jgi:hypothetical protein
MLPEDELQQRWFRLLSAIHKESGKEYTLDDLLILIGMHEAGVPSQKKLSESEKADLLQLGICSVLVPAKYFELIWVDDIGWPHFKQLRQLPNDNPAERIAFLKKYVLLYNERNKLLIKALPHVKK